ncbi:PH domain-containing protein [Corynebacterium freiburgense]|uniref:PH domain-containing protein n=1 Tax=Corynebacterium freiburgense TaxID=556548 RepID=UPI0004073A38|nr:PH domain-containing protein [Corynebacterium freiburgense]WJZ01780.1 Bacterial membrane flanked domain protein [Corynebacterium freiburgense]
MKTYRKVHKLTPLLMFWQIILAAIAIVVVNLNGQTLREIWLYIHNVSGFSWGAIAVSIVAFLLICALVWGVSYIWWRAYGYSLDGEEISVKSGVLNTKLRTARYDRIQAVDVVENVISRIFRVAAIRVETAGGNDSVIKIAYLNAQVARDVRDEILQARRGEHQKEYMQKPDNNTGNGDESRYTESQEIIAPIPIQRSIAAAVLLTGPTTIIAVTAGVVGGPAILLPALVALVQQLWDVIDRSWNFTATLDDDVLHVSYGLADKRKQSIPLGRIHAVQIRQPLLWRLCGWWRVDVSIAGYAVKDKRAGTTRLLPVGTKAQALELVSIISPLDYAELEEYAAPEGFCKPDFLSPVRARWISPIDFSRQAVTLLGHAVILHQGRLSRCVKIIHPSHIQELSRVRGPIQRLLQLDSVRLDLVSGPVRMTAHDLDPADSELLMRELRGRKLPIMR